jgi:hypothetical protein
VGWQGFAAGVVYPYNGLLYIMRFYMFDIFYRYSGELIVFKQGCLLIVVVRVRLKLFLPATENKFL